MYHSPYLLSMAMELSNKVTLVLLMGKDKDVHFTISSFYGYGEMQIKCGSYGKERAASTTGPFHDPKIEIDGAMDEQPSVIADGRPPPLKASCEKSG
ncbi:hypothetical protein M5K25_006867 [Dendrobium thyrsiflorum]|uniref:Uncharacterized protein n=1 Tax=Dendrobium thyrsiflorum TaxID=117978 RepID=A0ABD0VCW3_DENTH